MDTLLKEYIYGDTIIELHITYIQVVIGVTSTSVLDILRYNYAECCGLHPIDLINKAWQDHEDEMEEIYGEYEE